MPYTDLETEHQQELAVIFPDLGIGTYRTPWFSMETTHKLVCHVLVGDLGNLATFDCALLQATDANGAGAKAIAGKAITQLTQAGGDSDDYCTINLRTEEMDVQNRFCYVQVRVRVLVAASNFAVLVLGNVPRYAPVSLGVDHTEDVP